MIPRRPYGNEGDQISIVGFGGIIVMNEPQDRANRLVAEAIERGVNYFDVAPGYGDAEIKLGPALAPYRHEAFLACKTGMRTAREAEEELNRSLERLRTDHFDLYQLHGITDVAKDVQPALEPGGICELLDQAKKDGRIRHAGFSAHSVEAAVAALDGYAFDSVLTPINFRLWTEGRFGPRIVEAAQGRGATVLALKAMALGHWKEGDPKRDRWNKCWYEPIDDPELGALALRWTLGQPVASAIPPGHAELWRHAVEVAGRYEPLRPEEESHLRDLAARRALIFEYSGA